MKEAFLYCWTDLVNHKLYVGVHKGIQNDGYICSSKKMLEEYNKRQEDFKRKIYDSYKAAGAALGCNYNIITKRVKRGQYA